MRFPQAVVIRVAFNATPLLGELSGVGYYTRELSRALLARDDIEASFFYAAHWSESLLESPPPGAATARRALRSLIPGLKSLSAWLQQSRFHAGVRRINPALYHEPNYVAFDFDGPLVITIHDLSFVHHAETHPPERVARLRKKVPATLARASQVITDSKFVREEVIATFGVPPERVSAVALGVAEDFHPRASLQTAEALGRLGLSHGAYVLFVGTIEPRKNLDAVISAHVALPAPLRERYPLIIAGGRGWQDDALGPLLRSAESAGHIRRLGYVARDVLPHVYAGAALFVYPSLYEGFGLPPLEAMASGVPVIVSNAAALPEVVGDAGLLVSPQDTTAWRESIANLLEDRAAAARLSDRGLARAREFSWTSCGAQTVAIYRRALAS
ncbi:MAG TPA: glycosyltransferase family 1 protein [Polyangiaceae bacterium]|jgi:alpha-1,3-rhamnosyl/mannosyltransferase